MHNRCSNTLETRYRKGALSDNVGGTMTGAFLAIALGIIVYLVLSQFVTPDLPIVAALMDITGGGIS
jgi:hypothetical protein